MTAKEQLLAVAPGWSEHDAQVALRAVEHEHAVPPDEDGDLRAFGDGMMGDALRRLDEQERGQLGQRIAEASPGKRSA